MVLAVFKTVAGRLASSWVGSTPMRSRHLVLSSDRERSPAEGLSCEGEPLVGCRPPQPHYVKPY